MPPKASQPRVGIGGITAPQPAKPIQGISNQSHLSNPAKYLQYPFLKGGDRWPTINQPLIK